MSTSKRSQWPLVRPKNCITHAARQTEVYRRIPLAILMTEQLAKLSVPARAALCAWWLTHFCSATAVALFYDDIVAGIFMIKQGDAQIWGVVIAFVFHFAANIFLVLAVAVLWNSPRVTEYCWRYRFVIDGVVSLPLVVSIFLQ